MRPQIAVAATQVAVVCGLLLGAGCSKPPPAPPRSSDEIFQEQMQLPAVYLTHPSGHRLIAPQGKGKFIDENSGEIAWRALACNRPDCPGRATSGEPFLFVAPDPMLHVGDDGAIHADNRRMGDEPEHAGQCPKCWEQRSRAAESAEQRQQFINWVEPYVLPESGKRFTELEIERIRRSRRERHEAIKNSSAVDDEESGSGG